MDSADSSAARRDLADAATATGRAQQQKPKRIRREGRALNNVISIIEDDVQGQRGRVELIREHPCETTTNYAGAVCLRCNLDAQSIVRLPPLCFRFGALAHDRAEARVGIHEQGCAARIAKEPRDASF